MVIDMKEIGKMVKEKEKEYIILIKVNGKVIDMNIIIIMVIDMKEILKMVKKKEKEYFIIIMVIEKWEII